MPVDERPAPLLAPQRRLVGLEAPRPQQVLERALPLDQGGREREDGERGGAHVFRFFFATMIGPRAWPVNPEDLGVEAFADHKPSAPRGNGSREGC